MLGNVKFNWGNETEVNVKAHAQGRKVANSLSCSFYPTVNLNKRKVFLLRKSFMGGY